MFQFTSAVISFFVAFPIICYLLIFILCKQITKKHRLSVNFALDISTLFFYYLRSFFNCFYLGGIAVILYITSYSIYWCFHGYPSLEGETGDCLSKSLSRILAN